jgi:hypothetical protein
LIWGVLSDERTSRSFMFAAAGLQECSHWRVQVPQDSRPYFTVSNLMLSQPGGPGPRIYIQLHPRTLGYLVIASYDSHCYGGGIGTRLHAGVNAWSKSKSHYDRQSVGQSVLVSGAHLGPATNFSISLRFSFRQLRFVML